MSREEVVDAMAVSVLAGREAKHVFASEVAHQWWVNFVRGALRVAEANGWHLVQLDDVQNAIRIAKQATGEE